MINKVPYTALMTFICPMGQDFRRIFEKYLSEVKPIKNYLLPLHPN